MTCYNDKKLSRSERQVKEDIERVKRHFHKSVVISRNKRLYPDCIVNHNGVIYCRSDYADITRSYSAFLVRKFMIVENVLGRYFSKSALNAVKSMCVAGTIQPSDIVAMLIIEDGYDEVLAQSYLFNL